VPLKNLRINLKKHSKTNQTTIWIIFRTLCLALINKVIENSQMIGQFRVLSLIGDTLKEVQKNSNLNLQEALSKVIIIKLPMSVTTINHLICKLPNHEVLLMLIISYKDLVVGQGLIIMVYSIRENKVLFQVSEVIVIILLHLKDL
jgi:hypothetical protein